MSVHPYSDRQIEISNLLNSVGKDGEGVPADIAEEILNMVGDADMRRVAAESIAESENTETMIKLKLMDEKDWRKRAALCALLISRSLEV